MLPNTCRSQCRERLQARKVKQKSDNNYITDAYEKAKYHV